MTSSVDPLLSVVGIAIDRPLGHMTRAAGWTTVGTLVVTSAGDLTVVPRHRISAPQHQRLIAAASMVWCTGRDVLQGGWTYVSALGWIAEVLLRDDAAAEVVAACERMTVAAALGGGV